MATVAVGRIGGEEIIFIGSKTGIAMTMAEGKEKRQNIQNTLRLATCSELRRGILASLREGKKALRELREKLEVSSTTAIHALRELEKENLVFEDEDRYYALTKIGEVIALKLSDFVDAIEVLKKHEDFWLTHDLSGIPPHLLEKIGALKDSILLEDTPTDIFKAHATFLQILETAKEMKGISSIFHPEYPTIIEELVIRKGIEVELILTDKVLDKTLEVAEKSIKKLLRKQNFTLLVIDQDVKVALTVTDSVFHFGLFDNRGTYDYNRDMINNDKNGLSWGRALYKHYHQKSKVVEPGIFISGR